MGLYICHFFFLLRFLIVRRIRGNDVKLWCQNTIHWKFTPLMPRCSGAAYEVYALAVAGGWGEGVPL